MTHVKGWQANASLVSSNTQLGPVTSLLNVNFPEPGIYTAEFNITQPSPRAGGPPPATPTSNLRCQAILNWTVEGNQIQRIFDVGNGTTISGAGAGANISVRDLTATLPSSSGTNGVEYLVSISITKGTRAQFQVPVIQPGGADFIAGVAQPTVGGLPVIGPAGIAATAGALYTIPQNAGIVGVKISVIDTTVPATRPTFVVATQFNTAASVNYYQWSPDSDPSFVPIVPGATLINVKNNSAADGVSVSLDWAVDG